MLHLPYNIKIIRSLAGLNQAKFAEHLGVSLAMQKSYEIGKAAPDGLYLQRLSVISSVKEQDLKGKKIKEEDVSLKVEKVEEKKNEADSDSSNDKNVVEFNDRSVFSIAESNRILAEATKTQAEANKALSEAHLRIAKNNEDLIRALLPTVGVIVQKPPVGSSTKGELLEFLSQIGPGKKWNSVEEAQDALKNLVAYE